MKDTGSASIDFARDDVKEWNDTSGEEGLQGHSDASFPPLCLLRLSSFRAKIPKYLCQINGLLRCTTLQ